MVSIFCVIDTTYYYIQVHLAVNRLDQENAHILFIIQINIYFCCRHKNTSLSLSLCALSTYKVSSMENKSFKTELIRAYMYTINLQRSCQPPQQDCLTTNMQTNSAGTKCAGRASQVLNVPTVTSIQLILCLVVITFWTHAFIDLISQSVWATGRPWLRSCGWQWYSGWGSPGPAVWGAL